jgi:hypothetical protein
MSIHQPPQKLSSIFNNNDYILNDKPLTIDEAAKSFITYPTAQGKINLLDVDVGGTADFKTIPKTSLSPVDNEDLTNKEYVDGLLENVVKVDTTQTITGVKTFSNNVVINGTLTTNGNNVFGNAESDTLIVNSSTTLKNDVVIGDDLIEDILNIKSRTIGQGMATFRNNFLGTPFTDKMSISGLYLGSTSSGHGLLAVPNVGVVNGFQFRNMDKDCNTLNTPFIINQDGSCSFSGNVSIAGTLSNSGDTTFGSTESNQTVVNSYTWLKNDVRFGNDELTDTLVNQCRSDFQARTVFTDFINSYAGQTDIYATQGLYLGKFSNGRAVLASPNNGTTNGFQFCNLDKDGAILNSPFYITQEGVCVTNGKLQVSADEFKVVDGALVSLPVGSVSQSAVNNLTTDLNLKANDNEVVHLLGNETIGGDKTFDNPIKFNKSIVIGNGAIFEPDNTIGKLYCREGINITGGANISGGATIGGGLTVSTGGTINLPVGSISDNTLSSNIPLKDGTNIFSGVCSFSDVNIGNDETDTLIIKSNTKNLGQTIFSNDISTHTDIGTSFTESGVYIGRQTGNIGTFVNGSNGGTGGFQFLNKDIDGNTINTPLTINRAGNTTIGGDLYAENKLITNVIEGVGVSDVSINSNGGLIKFTSNLVSNIEMSANGTTTMFKKLYARDVGTLQERITPVNISTGSISVDYSVNGLIYVSSSPSGGTTFTANITNVNVQTTGNLSCVITLLIDNTQVKRYCDTITINGSSYSIIFSGGASSIDVSTSELTQQSIAVIYTSSSTIPTFVISSINNFLA